MPNNDAQKEIEKLKREIAKLQKQIEEKEIRFSASEETKIQPPHIEDVKPKKSRQKKAEIKDISHSAPQEDETATNRSKKPQQDDPKKARYGHGRPTNTGTPHNAGTPQNTGTPQNKGTPQNAGTPQNKQPPKPPKHSKTQATVETPKNIISEPVPNKKHPTEPGTFQPQDTEPREEWQDIFENVRLTISRLNFDQGREQLLELFDEGLESFSSEQEYADYLKSRQDMISESVDICNATSRADVFEQHLARLFSAILPRQLSLSESMQISELVSDYFGWTEGYL